MPEGDTIHKLAARLRPDLLDQALEQLWWVGPRSQLVPRDPVVKRVEAQGKHLLITVGRSAILRVHLGLSGRCSRVPTDQVVRGRGRSVGLATRDVGYVFTRTRSAEVFGAGLRRQHPVLSQLGPELLVDPVPLDVVRARARALADGRSISAVLLDQRVSAGIGNVYRNEILFLAGIHPDTPALRVPDDALATLFDDAVRLLGQNLGPGRRITTRRDDGSRDRALPPHYVYDRAHEPCLRCLTPIRVGRERENARPSWWCPACQPVRN